MNLIWQFRTQVPTVRAPSLAALKWFVEEKIESDVGRVIGSPDE
jgi:hypothetical protein